MHDIQILNCYDDNDDNNCCYLMFFFFFAFTRVENRRDLLRASNNKPADVFLKGGQRHFLNLHMKVLAKSVHILGMFLYPLKG